MIYGGGRKCRKVPLYLRHLYYTIVHVTTQVAIRVSGFIKFNFTLFCWCEIFKMNEGKIGKVGAAIYAIHNVDGLSLLMKKRWSIVYPFQLALLSIGWRLGWKTVCSI